MSYRLQSPLDSYEHSEDILAEVRAALDTGAEPPVLTVREFLGWFDAQRRGPNIVSHIDKSLLDAGLETVPNYIVTYIDDDIAVRALSAPASVAVDARPAIEISDPTLRIGSLKSEKNAPVAVSPTDSVAKAVTLMMAHDFSQLPVITGPRDIRGIISWRLIGERLAAGRPGAEVRHFMAAAYVVSYDDYFFKVLPSLIENEYVLVRGADHTLTSIVTTTDISLQFLQLTEPFLLLNEIENNIRIFLQRWCNLESSRVSSVCEIEDSYTGIFDLSFGDYIRLFNSELMPSPFPLNIDRTEFTRSVDAVRQIRNDVMHFSADPTPSSSIDRLRKVSAYLRTLQAIST